MPERALLPLPPGVPLAEAALLGCAVLTGYGAVHHSARVQSGESVVIHGVGGVGLAAVQSARIAGASRIIAVDAAPEREAQARAAGATDFLTSTDGVAREVRALTEGVGADVAIECVGRASSMRAAWSSTRRGGRTTVVGIGGRDEQVAFSVLEIFLTARTLSGCVYGNSDPARDLPVLAEHVREGRLDLSGMVADRIALDALPGAFEALRNGGGGGRVLVLLDPPTAV